MSEMQLARVEPDTELKLWANDLGVAYTAATSLVKTSFVPRTYAGKPEEAAAAIMTGAELGLSPLAALRAIDIISGTPAMRSITLRAIVQSHGHQLWTEESTKTRAIVCGQRKGSDRVERSEWTIDRARDLGLLGKDNWKKQPIAMLLARATAECARLIAADAILAIPYTVEELSDQVIDEPVKPVRRSAAKSVKREPLPDIIEPEVVNDGIESTDAGEAESASDQVGSGDQSI